MPHTDQECSQEESLYLCDICQECQLHFVDLRGYETCYDCFIKRNTKDDFSQLEIDQTNAK